MTIFGTGYRSLEFKPLPGWKRAWPLVVSEFRSLFRSIWGVLVFLVLQIPLLFHLFMVLLSAGVLQISGGREDARERVLSALGVADVSDIAFYADVVFSSLFRALPASYLGALVLTTLVSSRAVARDRETQALELLWTRGLSPLGYFLAKWSGSVLLLGIGFVVTPTLLWCMAWSMVDDPEFLASTLPRLPRLLAGLAAFTLLISGFAVGMSALFRGPNVSSFAWVLLIVGADVVRRMLLGLSSGQEWVQAISIWGSARRVAEWIGGVTPVHEFSPGYALVTCGLFAGWIGLGVLRRMRDAEAIG